MVRGSARSGVRLLPLTNTQRCERFGRFRFKPDPRPWSKERIRILEGWAEKNIADVLCPQLGRTINLHHKAAGPFLALFAAWDRAGLLGHVATFNGAWAPRFKRGRNGGVAALSNHAWGTAFDINARQYPLGYKVPANAPIRDLVPIANDLGWFWGGDFRSRPDGMHFEYTGHKPALTALQAAYDVLAGRLTRAEVRVRQATMGGLQADGLPGPKTLARAKSIVAAQR